MVDIPESIKYDYRFKYIVVGSAKVGKTCFIKRFVDDTFDENEKSTIFNFLYHKYINSQEKTFKLEIHDIALHETAINIAPQFIRGAVGVFLVFSLSDIDSINVIDKWYKLVTKTIGYDSAKFFIIGTQNDNGDQDKADKQAHIYAKKRQMKYYSTSAKTGSNVEEAFVDLTQYVYQDVIDNKIELVPTYNLWSNIKKNSCIC